MLTESIEDYCLNLAMDEATKTPLLNREEALKFLEEDSNDYAKANLEELSDRG